jgi:O-acetylhomoserine (thiol)-lyase
MGNFDSAISTPIVTSAAYKYANSQEAEDIFAGNVTKPLYARMGNPTSSKLEMTLAKHEGGIGALATSSGMGAVSMVISSLVESGDEIISIGGLFGGNYAMFKETFSRFGIKTHFVSMDEIEKIPTLINDKTKIIFCESVGNPSLRLAPIDKIANIANKYAIAFLVDNTTTPYLFPFKYGADIVLYSTTKIITGNSSALGGAAIFRAINDDEDKFKTQRYKFLEPFINKLGNKALIACSKKRALRDFGMIAHPHSSYQALLGLETLEIRNKTIKENAEKIATSLYQAGLKINHPSLAHNIDYKLYNSLYIDGASSLMTLDVETKERAFKLLDSIKNVTLTVNFGDTRTLALHMASTIYRDFNKEEQKFLGVSDGLIRISIGLENPQLIIDSFLEAYRELN